MTIWCKANYLGANVDKTRDFVVNLRKKGYVSELIIDGATVYRGSEYKYLGKNVDNRNLSLNATTTTL